MINGLRGKIIDQESDSVTLDVHGICYKVFVSNDFMSKVNALTTKSPTVKGPKEIFVHTFLSVRENALDLYGFINTEDKKLFQLLLTVSGIGPKSAMNIMNSITLEMIEESISKDDAKYLAKVSGIGKKTAEKILVGLKDKVGLYSPGSSRADGNSDDSISIEALVSIGYTERDARAAIRSIDTKGKDTQTVIKEALKNLN
jgi:holliday junction DNA helicase RuvA